MKKMPNFVPQTVSARAIQRSYKQVVKQLNESDEPILVMNRNQPEFAMLSLKKYQEYQRAQAFNAIERVRQKNNEIDPDEAYREITAELEAVRKARYEQNQEKSST